MDGSDDIRVDSAINGLFCRRRGILPRNDVLGSEVIENVHLLRQRYDTSLVRQIISK